MTRRIAGWNRALDEDATRAIETALAGGDRVEIIPGETGVQIVCIHRKTVYDSRKKEGPEAGQQMGPDACITQDIVV